MNTLSRRLPPPRHAALLGRAAARWAVPLALTALGVALAQPQSPTKQVLSIGDLNSGYNREVWAMSIWAIAFSIIIFIGVSWALFYTVAKYRERPTSTHQAEDFHGNNKLEVALVGVPVIIVAVLCVLTVKSMAVLNPTPKTAVPVDIEGRQFFWNFRYPQAKVDTALVSNGNELVLPAGRPVALTITAADVIHAFWAPNLGGQRDAIPTVKKTWQVNSDKPGVYQGNCSVLCGASHANMRFKVVVLPQDRFNTFIQAAQAYKAPTPAAGSAEARGEALFLNGKNGQGSCAACHRVQGTNAAGVNGPDLSFFGTRRTLGAGMWEGDKAREMLPTWIKHSKVVKPGSLMPSYDGTQENYPALTDAELADLSAYLRSLKLPEQADYWQGVDHNTAFWGEKK